MYDGVYGKSEVTRLLRGIGVAPRKSMGQNFLIERAVAESIVSELDPQEQDVVIEIGPGIGALTHCLAGRVRRLILVEFDQKMAGFLKDRFAGDSSVEVWHMDAVHFDLRPFFKEGGVKVIGNLPYSCAGEIMRRFLDPPSPVNLAIMMLQKEVANRLIAIPRTKPYGRLTLLTQVGWKVDKITTLPPDPFYPRPAVDSTVLRLRARGHDGIEPFSRKVFDRLLRCGFAQRRKQLKRQLPTGEVGWSEFCEVLGISQTARAEELSLDSWLAMSRFLDSGPLKDTPQSDDEMFDVVDDDNVVIGQGTRSEVHKRGLQHRAVHVFVFNSLNELYLQKRSNLKDSAPSLWGSSASGHLDAGENYQSAASRELGEELGVNADVQEVGNLKACEATGAEFVRLFRAEHGGAFESPCSEVETGMFMSTVDIARWVERRPQDFAPGFVACWNYYCAQIGKS
ncbi:MAG: ribosomal RNA small subunit methyltransferase A [Verrucomicrobiaceae bacterium]|nr:ribosomal RNA small subunit methyltransferase A [Verrucomicrobiaceae bacterium]